MLVDRVDHGTVLVNCGPQKKPIFVGRTSPGVRARKRCKLRIESKEHLKRIYLEHVQHCTDLPLQVTLSVQSEQEKMEPGFG